LRVNLRDFDASVQHDIKLGFADVQGLVQRSHANAPEYSKLLRPLTKMWIGVHSVGVGMISRLRDSMPKRGMRLDSELAAEAKSIVALAFRNGPIEDVHAGKECSLPNTPI